MSDERIEKTQSAIATADHIPADKKASSATLSKLQPALAEISQTHQEHAETIARLVEASAHERLVRKTPGTSQSTFPRIATIRGKLRSLSSAARRVCD
jgi:hypothetical protein